MDSTLFNSILYYNTKRDKCQYLYLHYLSKLVNNSYEKQLLTPFKWTYPSKKRGQKIQIKGFTNNKK